MKKIIEKLLSRWGFVPLVMALLTNFIVYFSCNRMVEDWTLYSLALPIDKKIPLIPWTIIIYFGCYIFWIVNYILIYRREREYAYRFFTADFLSRMVCLVFFIAYPTTLERPVVEGSGVFEEAVRLLYVLDAPTNLFPSIHCLVSWFCFIGIVGDKNIKNWYKIASFFMALAVFISTLTTRQHVILDVIAGVILAQLTYYISQKTQLWKIVEKPFDRLNRMFVRN